jgi:predicted metal-dependent hydrolase
MKSLLKNQEPLKMYTLDPRADISLTLKDLNLEESFWQRSKVLHRLISTIAEFQKMSESDHATLGKVFPR